MNDGPVDVLMSVLECCIPTAPAKVPLFKLPAFPALPALPNLAWFGHKADTHATAEPA
jgi:hypothetical protein